MSQAKTAFHPNGASEAGRMKIAEPMMLPTTSAVASQIPNLRRGAFTSVCLLDVH
jgi:hypothetical protein